MPAEAVSMGSAAEQAHLAYVFERFPSYNQTFCIREVLALQKIGVRAVIFSLRDCSEEEHLNCPPELREQVITLPQGKRLNEEVRALMEKGFLPKIVHKVLGQWERSGFGADKRRVYEAAWIGHYLRTVGRVGSGEERISSKSFALPAVNHAHCHFAGMAARTLWWLKKFHGLSYSITAHANDVFCPEDLELPISLQSLMDEAGLVVTVSDFSKDWLERRFASARDKVVRVYNGLELAPYSNYPALGIEGEPFCFLSVGRLVEKKGFAHLIEACALLKNKLEGQSGKVFRCLIVGEGPQQGELEKLIVSHQLENVVSLVGSLDSKGIYRLLQEEAGAFVLPCQVESDGGMDNLPTVIMEAMAAALPVISTEIAGIPEMLVDGESGILLPEAAPESIAVAMEKLLNNRPLCRELGLKGRERCEEKFCSEVTAQELFKYYRSVGLLRAAQVAQLADEPKNAEKLKNGSLQKSATVAMYRAELLRKFRGKFLNLRRFMKRAEANT